MGATEINILRDALFGNPPHPKREPSREGVMRAFTEMSLNTEAGIAAAAISGGDLNAAKALIDPLVVAAKDGQAAAQTAADNAGKVVSDFVDSVPGIVRDATSASQTAATRAENAANMSLAAALTAPNVYQTIAAGLAATTSGRTFFAQSGSGKPTLYRNNNGTAVAQGGLGGGSAANTVSLSSYTPADGKLIGIVAMTAGSAVLNALRQQGSPAPVAFGPEDVGKRIKVAGVMSDDGTADLYSTIVSVQSATRITLADAARRTVGQSTQVGAVLGTDAGPGLQAALTAAAGFGGTLVIDGVYAQFSAATRRFGEITIISADSNSGILIAGTRDMAMATFLNCAIDMTEAYFAGCPGAVNDCWRLFDFNTSSFRIHRSGFFGLSCRSGAAGAALIRGYRGDFQLTENEFGGCIGESGNDFSVVDIDEFQSVTTRYNKFIDYGTFLGHLHSKTGIGFTLAWIRIRSPLVGGGSVDQGSVVRMQDDRFDEGCLYGVMIQPDLDRPVIQHLHMSGLRTNNSLLEGGSAYKIRSVENVLIEQPTIGWANQERQSFVIEDCGTVTIDSPYITAGAPGASSGTPDGIIARNIRSLTLRNAGALRRRGFENITRIIDVSDGMGGVLPFAKRGRVVDADFPSPPPNGTVALDLHNNRLYTRFPSGWLAGPVMATSDDAVFPLVNVTPSTGTMVNATTFRKTSAAAAWDASAHRFQDLTSFRMRVRVVGKVSFMAIGAVRGDGPFTPQNMGLGLYVELPNESATVSSNLIFINAGEVQSGGTTVTENDVIEMRYNAANRQADVFKNGAHTAIHSANAPFTGAYHFGGTVGLQNGAFELLEWSAL